MSAIELIQLAAEVGILSVAAGLFLYRANKQEEIRNKREEEDREYYKEQKEFERTERLEKEKEQRDVLDYLMKRLLEDKHTVDKEDRINDIEKQINTILKDLLYATNAGRAYFMRYHNGGHDLNNISFLKMSMTNEITRQGVSHAMRNFSNQFRAIFPWLIESIDSGIPVHADDLEKVKTVDHSLHEYLTSQNVTRAHAVCIRNKNKQVVGFIAISYLSEQVFLPNAKIEEILLLEQAKLETLLSLTD